MKNIKISFEFADMNDALDMLGRVNGYTTDPDEPVNHVPAASDAVATQGGFFKPAPGAPLQNNASAVLGVPGYPTPPTASELAGDRASLAAAGVLPTGVEVTTPVAPAPDTGTKIKGTTIKAALAAYKEANGHPKYKELLAYFGVTSVRAIPTKDYEAVMQAVSGQAPEGTPAAPEDITPDVDDGLGAVAITPEQLRQSLSDHKARWGMDATTALINRLGYNTPNDIASEDYTAVYTAVINDDPAAAVEPTPEPAPTADVDLSIF